MNFFTFRGRLRREIEGGDQREQETKRGVGRREGCVLALGGNGVGAGFFANFGGGVGRWAVLCGGVRGRWESYPSDRDGSFGDQWVLYDGDGRH